MNTNINYLKKYIIRYKKQFIIAVTALIIEIIGDLLQPAIMSRIIDKGVKERNMDYVLKLGGLMLLLTALGALFVIIRNIASSRLSQGFGADLREDLYTKIQSFSFDNIDRFHDASLITRLTNDVNQMQNFAHGMTRVFVRAPVLGIGAIIMAFLLNPHMGLILLGIVPIAGIIIFLNLKVSYPIFKKIQKALDGINKRMREYLAGIRVVKAFNRFDYEGLRFRKANDELKNITLKGMRTIAIFNPLVAFVVNMGIVLILWFGGIRVNAGDMEVGKIVAFINYMTQLLFALVMMTRILNISIRAKASSDRIREVFEAENTIPISENPITLKGSKVTLKFEDVYFKYHNSGRYVLKNINFSINFGETIGIIGPTGSGKTSLINLIPRFYDVNKGKIIIDGIDIRDVSLEELRERIAIVPQKTLLFTGDIRDNIKWGDPMATDEEVRAVAKIAQADEFITSFSEGYMTYLGQGGVNLSGGQKQRISIARALIKKPNILILDDSTSAVDMITERKIREALKEYIHGITTILIAQRVTSVMDADRILVMDSGMIIGQGTHTELMEICQVYRDIYYSQIGEGVEGIGS